MHLSFATLCEQVALRGRPACGNLVRFADLYSRRQRNRFTELHADIRFLTRARRRKDHGGTSSSQIEGFIQRKCHAPFWRAREEDNDGKISRRGNCRRASACGFGTEFCRQTDTSKVTREECREFAILCGRVRKFGDPRVWPRRPLCTWRELARPLVALPSLPATSAQAVYQSRMLTKERAEIPIDPGNPRAWSPRSPNVGRCPHE